MSKSDVASLDENSLLNIPNSLCQKLGSFKQVDYGAIFVFDGTDQ